MKGMKGGGTVQLFKGKNDLLDRPRLERNVKGVAEVVVDQQIILRQQELLYR